MIVFNDVDHGFAIANAARFQFNPAVDTVVSRVDAAGQLMGGIVYQGYTKASIGMHVAGFHPTWINKDVLWVAFHYPFVQLGCTKVFGQVPSGNLKTLEFDRKLGFIEEARISDVFPDGEALVVLSMPREHCRWLKLKPAGLREGGSISV